MIIELKNNNVAKCRQTSVLLKEFRISKHLSQEKFARLLGISLSMQVQVESGRTKASRGYMERLKKTFPEVSIDLIFFGGNENEQIL